MRRQHQRRAEQHIPHCRRHARPNESNQRTERHHHRHAQIRHDVFIRDALQSRQRQHGSVSVKPAALVKTQQVDRHHDGIAEREKHAFCPAEGEADNHQQIDRQNPFSRQKILE